MTGTKANRMVVVFCGCMIEFRFGRRWRFQRELRSIALIREKANNQQQGLHNVSIYGGGSSCKRGGG